MLNIGNRLNTAGPTRKGKAGAFTIESLLKLSQAKAFDKKTTFLHYIVMVVKRNNESLVSFKNDLPSVLKSDKIYWDQCENDLEEVENQLENVRKISLHEVYGKNRPSWARRKKGKDDDDMSQESMTLEAEVEALRSTNIGIFTLDAIKKVSNLRENVERTKSKFYKLLEYFGEEDKKKMSPHHLFEIMVTFTKDFDTALEEVAEFDKKKRRTEKKKQGIRSSSPSNISRDSASRDEESSTRSGLSPSRALRASALQPNLTPSKPLRASALQPHMNSSINSRPKETRNFNQQHVEKPLQQRQSSYESEHSMSNTKPVHTGSPRNMDGSQHFSDDSVSKATSEVSDGNFQTNKTMTTSGSTDSESQGPTRNIVISDDSKEGCDENAVPGLSNKSHQFSSYLPQQPNAEVEPFGDRMDERISTINIQPKRQQQSRYESPIKSPVVSLTPVPSTVRTQPKSSDELTRTKPDRQSMRQKARALRQQRVKSQRQSSENSPQRPKHHQIPIESDIQSRPQHPVNGNSRESRQYSDVSPQPVEKSTRRKPPSPEDLRLKPNISSSSPSESTKASQERIMSRRERMRRRGIETS